MANDMEVIQIFPTAIYKTTAAKYIDNVRLAALDAIHPEAKLNELHPCQMSDNIVNDERVYDFAKYVIQTAWNILTDQGYDITGKQTVFESMWMQEHHKLSGMEQHIHNNGVMIVGFFFLDTPEESSMMRLHDPRSGKIATDLKKGDESQGTFSASDIAFKPQAGDLFFTNAWLPHSFSRHNNDEPLRFIHINISVKDAPASECSLPTIV